MCAEGFFDFHQRVAQRRRAAAKPAAPAPSAGDAQQALSVSQLTALIDRALRALPERVLVRGEVSNFKHHGASGHMYFVLKDPEACIDCVMFRADAAKLKFAPEDGVELLASGRVGVYGQRGRYQLYVERLEPLGQGALELAFRQLCARLEAEGLFRPERKKPLPRYPARLALVTSTQTAALQDMLKVLRRFAWVRLLVCHVPVQGDGSAEKIAAMLGDLNRCCQGLGGIDAILLARGGGSLEDLWEFNEEIVARAICASAIPTITGIGHEIDVSVADLCADYHAHTPTEAAQVAIAAWREARDAIDRASLVLRRDVLQVLADARQRLAQAERCELFRRPLDRTNQLRQRLDHAQQRLDAGLLRRIRQGESRIHGLAQRLEQNRPAVVLLRIRSQCADAQQRLSVAMAGRLRACLKRTDALHARLSERHPRHQVKLCRQHLLTLERRLERSMAANLAKRQDRLGALEAHLNAIGPEQVLQRGYSITTIKKTGAIVREPQQVKAGDRLVTRLAGGSVESVAEDARQLPLFE